MINYLETPPSKEELGGWLRDLGLEHPREMMRQKDDLYRELELAEAEPDVAMSALAAHPKLIERPIVRKGGRAIIARPPKKLQELLA